MININKPYRVVVYKDKAIGETPGIYVGDKNSIFVQVEFAYLFEMYSLDSYKARVILTDELNSLVIEDYTIFMNRFSFMLNNAFLDVPRTIQMQVSIVDNLDNIVATVSSPISIVVNTSLVSKVNSLPTAVQTAFIETITTTVNTQLNSAKTQIVDLTNTQKASISSLVDSGKLELNALVTLANTKYNEYSTSLSNSYSTYSQDLTNRLNQLKKQLDDYAAQIGVIDYVAAMNAEKDRNIALIGTNVETVQKPVIKSYVDSELVRVKTVTDSYLDSNKVSLENYTNNTLKGNLDVKYRAIIVDFDTYYSIKLAELKGEKGDKGATGLTGPVGPAPTMTVGSVIPTTGNPEVTITGTNPYSINFKLKTGTDGINGVNGADGSRILFGTVQPVSSLGVNGDMYYNSSNCDIFSKESSAWVLKGNLKGATGNVGATNTLTIGTVVSTSGNPSATITGTAPNQTLNFSLKTGANGPSNTLEIGTVTVSSTASATITGTSPNQILNLNLPRQSFLYGTSDPTNTLGNVGDYYINTVTKCIFEKINSTTWSKFVDLSTSGTATNSDKVDGHDVWSGTTLEYEAIAVKSPTTLYFIK